ncbi:MAG: ATP-binding protein [Candidatus Hydrogenedentes bacterium]|nr:ATP-binding protein [Candidatus Hydrogenedentota bacterium]
MIPRNLNRNLAEAMADTPVVVVHGARQTGKSTLVLGSEAAARSGTYLTLDDATLLAAALDDPMGFISKLDGTAILDEVQQAPDLFRAIKYKVDKDRRPGQFLLTGSADILLLPSLSESLAGRMEILTLWPFSWSEIAEVETSFVDQVFASPPLKRASTAVSRMDILQRAIIGGFPAAIDRTSTRRRSAWFSSYIASILQRDVRDISNVEHLAAMPRLLEMLATRSMALLNYAELSRALRLPQSTLKRYMALLEMTFLIREVPAWSSNLGKRLVKSPKIMLCDTGLMAYLLDAGSPDEIPDQVVGALLENYVAMEITKHLGWSNTRARLYHFRESAGREVDLLLESASGNVVGIEVKSAAQVSSQDFKHLRFLQEELGNKFHRGVVLYTGTEAVSFGDRLQAVPIGVFSGKTA